MAAVGEIIRKALVVLPVVAEERFRDGPWLKHLRMKQLGLSFIHKCLQDFDFSTLKSVSQSKCNMVTLT